MQIRHTKTGEDKMCQTKREHHEKTNKILVRALRIFNCQDQRVTRKFPSSSFFCVTHRPTQPAGSWGSSWVMIKWVVHAVMGADLYLKGQVRIFNMA